MSSLNTKIIKRTDSPAPQAYSRRLKYGIALNTAIMLLGKTHEIAVAGGVENIPEKKPLMKLNIPVSGVKSMVNKPAIFEKIYSATLKQSKAICSMSSMIY